MYGGVAREKAPVLQSVYESKCIKSLTLQVHFAYTVSRLVFLHGRFKDILFLGQIADCFWFEKWS